VREYRLHRHETGDDTGGAARRAVELVYLPEWAGGACGAYAFAPSTGPTLTLRSVFGKFMTADDRLALGVILLLIGVSSLLGIALCGFIIRQMLR
jgi:hypothetical protein